MSLGNRFILSLTLPLVAIMTLFGYMAQVRSRARVHAEMEREGRIVAIIAQGAIEDYLRDHQIEDLRDLMDQMGAFDRILGAQLYDPDGRLIYQSRGVQTETAVAPGDLAVVLHERKEVESLRRAGQTRALRYVLPLVGPKGESQGALQVVFNESFVDETAATFRHQILTLTFAMIAATALVVVVVTRASIARPVEALVRRFRAVGAGDLTGRAARGGRDAIARRDEFGQLASEFDGMVDRLEEARRSLLAEQEERRRAEAGLRQAERLASVGRLAAGLAHEIGTPLNVIGGRAEALLRRLQGHGEAERSLGIISAQIDRISRIVRGMLDFARGSAAHLSPTDLTQVVRHVLDLVEHRLKKSDVRAEVEIEPGLPLVRADEDQLHQVLLNLLTNALDAMPSGGGLWIGLCRAGSARARRPLPPSLRGAAGEFILLWVEDSGCGIPPAQVERIFDPFFTTKDVGQGTGLGLSVAYGIVRDHGGAIEVESQPGSGTRFTIVLPIDGPRTAPGTRPALLREAAAIPGGGDLSPGAGHDGGEAA